MKKIILFLLTASLLLFSCATQEEVTPELIEKTRIEYEKGEIQAINNLINIYRDQTLSIELREKALEALASTQHPDAYRAMRDYLNQAYGIEYGLLLSTAKKLAASDDPENMNSITLCLLETQKRFIDFRTEVMRNMEDSPAPIKVEQLLGMYTRSKEDFAALEESLTKVMGSIGDDRVIPILIHIAKDPKVKISVRNLAIELLARKKSPDITQFFIDMLNDPETELQVRDFALHALGDIKESRVILAFLDAYYSGREEYYKLLEALTSALGEFKDPAVIPALTEIIKDKTIPLNIRSNGLKALASFKNADSFLDILPMMEDPDNYVLFDEMADFASELGDPSFFNKLRQAGLKAQLKSEGMR